MATDLLQDNWNSSTVDVCAVKGTIGWSDYKGVARPDGVYEVAKLPKGALIKSVYLDVTTAFNGTTPTVTVGVTSDPDEFFAAATAVATIAVTKGTLGLDLKQATSEEIIITTALGASTAGEMTLYIEYIDTAARREMFTY